jgi:outer membrane protein assembly factor BamA
MAHGKLRTDLKTRFVYAGHLSFFGVGNETEKDEETNFKYQPFTVGFVETFRPGRFVFVGGGLEYMRIDTGPGDSDSVPSTEEEFTPENAPGLGTDPDYVNTSLFCAFDWRQSPGYTTSGGYYRFDFTDYNEQGGEDLFSFRRYDVELDQYVPIFRANQILAFRALTSFTEVEDGAQVPFFLMPKLGGSKELRGFRGHRFRDRYRLLLTAEYRWTPSKLMDLAFFYEWGKMASDADDLNLQDLHESIGIGARFHAPNATILRIELAHSSEYTRLIFDTGLVF